MLWFDPWKGFSSDLISVADSTEKQAEKLQVMLNDAVGIHNFTDPDEVVKAQYLEVDMQHELDAYYDSLEALKAGLIGYQDEKDESSW